MKNIDTNLFFLSIRCSFLILSFVCASHTFAGANLDETEPSNPFGWFADIPSSVDAAAVLNNPAERFLLKDSGKSIRSVLAMGGVFSQTEHAWDALAKAFDANTDDTIRALLGKKVVIVWDEMGDSADSVFEFANAMDNRWTLISEVDPAYLDTIRARLKPVRRRVEFGQPVYAIEMGRYEIALLNQEQTGGDSAIVLLAPRKGATLLDHVLESFTEDDRDPPQNDDQMTHPAGESILSHREDLIDDSIWGVMGDDWFAAWIIQLDRFLDRDDLDLEVQGCDQEKHSSAFVGMLSMNEQEVEAIYASDVQLDLPDERAPVGLLNAIGDDAVLAVVSAKLPNIVVDHKSFGVSYSAQVHSQGIAAEDQQSLPKMTTTGPGLILLSDRDFSKSKKHHAFQDHSSGELALTLLAEINPTDESITNAQQVDQMMYDLYWAYDPQNAPEFGGRFPDAIRTHQFAHRDQIKSAGSSAGSSAKSNRSKLPWPGDQAKLSWTTSTLGDEPVLFAALAPMNFDTAGQIKWISNAVKSLEAVSDTRAGGQSQSNVKSNVISRGYFRPARAVSILNTTSPLDLVLSKLVDRVSWDLGTTSYGVRGSLTITIDESGSTSTLGSDPSPQ